MMNVMARRVDFRVADWLSLAAAPTFALMAVVTGIPDSGAQQMSCSMHMSPVSGMAPMYALMSAFHFTTWLKLAFRWRGGARAQAQEPQRAPR
jgi:hypothetical protein